MNTVNLIKLKYKVKAIPNLRDVMRMFLSWSHLSIIHSLHCKTRGLRGFRGLRGG